MAGRFRTRVGGLRLFTVTPPLTPLPQGGDSAAEAAVRLQAKSLRSEGASIQCSCNARVVLFVLFTGGWEPNQSQISVNQFIIKCIVPNLSFKQQLRNRWFHNWLIISTLEHSWFPTSPSTQAKPRQSSMTVGVCVMAINPN